MSSQISDARFISFHNLRGCVTRFLKPGRLAAVVVLSVGLMTAQEPSPTAPLLTLDEAIQVAIANNRSLKIARLEVDKSKWQVSEFKANRLPSFNASVLGSQLLNEINPTFEERNQDRVLGLGSSIDSAQ